MQQAASTRLEQVACKNDIQVVDTQRRLYVNGVVKYSLKQGEG
jgi:hypothetical protein